MLSILSHSVAETQDLAEIIGRALRGGEVLEFVSDIGGGKTIFMKGLARGLAITDNIQSPTFTVNRVYAARDHLQLYHFDFYRLDTPGIIAAELAEALAQSKTIVAVEWGDIVHGVLPAVRAELRITSVDDDSRRLKFDFPDAYGYLTEAVAAYTHERGLL